jgi:outer membrane protein assembly factor BamE (lipoprotein component of BamABCDE complex)
VKYRIAIDATKVSRIRSSARYTHDRIPYGRVTDMKRTRITLGIGLSLALCLAWAGCQAWQHPSQPADAERLTVGTVQREIQIGMDAASVAETLGSPNIVTTDDQRREVWVYDKVSSDRVDSSRSDHATLIIIGTSGSESSSSTRQRTLTIIIKFDEQKRVRDFAYNYTQF